MDGIVDATQLLAIMPITYVLVDMLRSVPGIRSWMLPFVAAGLGMVLGVLWALSGGTRDGQEIMVYAAFGFINGASATGANQMKKQTLGAQGKEVVIEDRRVHEMAMGGSGRRDPGRN